MNVLLSAVGRRAYLVDYFKQAVHPLGAKVICTNTHFDATGMIVADIPELVPPAESPDFIPKLLELCRRHQVKMLFSLHDWEAPYIAMERERFLEIGTLPVMPNFETIKVCLDKYLTAQTAESLGIRVPKTFLAVEETILAIGRGELDFPIVVKPRWGQGSQGLYITHSVDEMNWAYYLSRSQGNSFGLVGTLVTDPEHGVIFQECIQGQEYGCDIVNDLEGNFVTAFVKKKIAMRSGETDGAETVDSPEIFETATKIARWSKHLGNMDSDFFIDEGGKVFLLELDPRFGGGYPFSHVAGADIPSACVAWRRGQAPMQRQLSVDIGVRAYKSLTMLRVN